MTRYFVRSKTRSWDGEAIGILILDACYPCVPGNVGNASTYHFPVRYKEVRGASIERLLNERDPSLLTPFVDAAKELEAEGVRAITGACGFMALFQKQVSAAVSIPVFISSLMQVPFVHHTLPPGKKVGIITANKSCLTPAHFQAVGIHEATPVVVYGMEDQTEFRTSILEEKGSLDSALIEREVTGVATKMVMENPDIGAVLLECSDLPPYAASVQEAVDLPVYDFNTMIEYVHSAIRRKRYEGYL